MPATLRTPSSTPGCPVTIAGAVITFASWDLDWELYSEIAVDGSYYIYNFTRSAAKAITAKGGSESAGYTVTVADIGTWVSTDSCLVLPSAFSTITTHASVAALQAAASALDTTVLGYAAADRPVWYEVYTQAAKPQHIIGHLSRQRNVIYGALSAVGDQSSNTTQVLWRNFGVQAAGTYGAVVYDDSGAGKTGGGIKCRRMWAQQTSSGLLCFYNRTSGNGKSQFEFCYSYGSSYGLGTVTGTITVYHCVAMWCGTAGYYGNNLASTYQNCVAVHCPTGFLGKTNGTYTKCASTDTTGSEAGLNSLTLAQLDFWEQGNNAGFYGTDPRIIATSTLYNAGTAIGGLTTDIDGNDISTLVPIGCHKGTVNAYGVTWPTGAQSTVNFVNFSGTVTGTAVAEAHTANQVLKSAGGNWNDDNLGVGEEGNVLLAVAFGLSQTGTLAAGATYYTYTSGAPVLQSVEPVALGATETTIYTCPADTRAVVRLTLTNTDSSARTATIHKVLSGETAADANAIKKTIPLAIAGSDGDDWVDCVRTLEEGDKISGLASSASVVIANIEVIEVPVTIT